MRFVLALTRMFVRFNKSRTKTSAFWLLSLTTRLVAPLLKATQRPSSLIRAMSANTGPPPWALAEPKRSRVTNVVTPETWSRTNKSLALLRSFKARLFARLSNRMNRPSGVITGQDEA